MKKRLMAFMLAAVLVLPLLTAPSFAAMSSVKVTKKGQVVDSITFRGVTVEAIYAPRETVANYSSDKTYCCAAFVRKFYEKVYGVSVSSLVRASSPKVNKGSFSMTDDPQVGDIMHHKWVSSNGAKCSHWAIVKSVNNNGTVTIIEQNGWYSKKDNKARVGKTVPKKGAEYTYYHYSGAGIIDPGGEETVTVHTAVVKDLTETSATLYGSAVSAGSKITQVGMYLSADPNKMKMLGGDSGTPSYNKNMWYSTEKYGRELEPGTTYYYMAYAIVDGKTYWGPKKSFTTLGVAPDKGNTSLPAEDPKPELGEGIPAIVNSNGVTLNITDGPGTGTVLNTMPDGARMTVYMSKVKRGWYYVEYDGVYGYAAGSAIALGKLATATCKADLLNVRSGPSTSYGKVTQIPRGAICIAYPDKTANGWVWVEYNGVQGYAAGNYITQQD